MADGPEILKASEPGLYYVRACESHKTESWQVGERYVLEKVLGEGSFSCVCLATDLETRDKVAVKRVGDVLASIDNAKRVLRECAILRRLSHPNIVGLRDLFTRPSSTGRGLVFRGGKLVSSSIDLYIVLEFCDQGDLFHLRGQLSETDVQFVMWQLLEVLRYIHACDVWHRDIKSANILISLQEGRRVAKLCDFGSARSASKLSSDGSDHLEALLGTANSMVLEPARPAPGTKSHGGADRGGTTATGAPVVDDIDRGQTACRKCGSMTRPNSGVDHMETDVEARMEQQQETQRMQLEIADRLVSEQLRSLGGVLPSVADSLEAVAAHQQQAQPMECGDEPPPPPTTEVQGTATEALQPLAANGLGAAQAVQQPPSKSPAQQQRLGQPAAPSSMQPAQPQGLLNSPTIALQPAHHASTSGYVQEDGFTGPTSPLTASDGRAAAVGVVQLSDLYARPSRKARGGWDQPMTRAVCTPCYRAPEVVMSHGQYSAALDMWSLGCVFGELLQRVIHPGKSTTPHLQVAPVISVQGMPMTPKQGERFEGPGNQTTCQELAALFAVVGTPAWGTIDRVVQHPTWRAYLSQIPGRPSQLYRRFALSGDAAADLLSRLLEFDPGRRATAEEAQQHAYFDTLKQQMQVWMQEDAEEQQEDLLNLMAAQAQADSQQGTPAGTPTFAGGLGGSLPPVAAPTAFAALQPGLFTAVGVGGGGPRTAYAPLSASPGSPLSDGLGFDNWWRDASMDPRHVSCVSQVLAGLEVELTRVCGGSITSGGAAPTYPATSSAQSSAARSSVAQIEKRLREMLEAECEEHQRAMADMMRQLKEAAWAVPGMPASGSSGGLSDMDLIPAHPQQQPQQQQPDLQGSTTPSATTTTANGAVHAPSAFSALVSPPSGNGGSASTGVTPRLPLLSLNHFPSVPLADVSPEPAAAAAAGGAAAGAVGVPAGSGRAVGGSGDMVVGSTGGAAGRPAPGPAHAPPSVSQVQARRQLLASKWGHRAFMYRRLGINRKQWALRPDPAANTEDPSDIGKERMGHHRDAEQAGLLPEQHLRAGRHQEWVPTSLVDSLRSAGGADIHSWGVSLAPPGMQESQMEPGMMEAIRMQHAR